MTVMLVMCKRNHCKLFLRAFRILTHQTSDNVSNALDNLPLRNIKVPHSVTFQKICLTGNKPGFRR